MAQTGILDYKRYLNTLQTLTNLGQTFPSNQQTYNFTVAGGSTASWPATISWETLILDKVSFSSKETGYIPNVDNSQIIGYYEGSTATQYSSGIISLPANMYTGPILPGGDFNVPLTVVHIEWFDGVTTYAQQIGFIQNWEPGVELGDPTSSFDFFAVYGLPSNLTLTGIQGLIYGDDLVLTATTDIPIDLGTNTRVRFYRKDPAGDILVGTSYFVGRTATFTLTTIGNFSIGVYEFYAVSSAYRNYLKATSNDLSVVVAAGVPLIVTTSTFTPDKAYYFIGETVTYNLGVIPDPAFTATGVAIASTVTIKLVNVFTPFTETPVANTNFVNGQTSNPFTVESYMVDLTRSDPRTTYYVTTSSYNTTTYTATLFVSNTETVVSSWDSQFIGRYASGSTSTRLTVAGTATVTIQGQAFPITITQDVNDSYLDDPFNIRVTTPNVAYYNTITIYANKGATTLQLYSTNSNGTSTFVAPITTDFVTSGSWSIYASYPGDLGSSIINANLPSTSNTLSHFKRDGYFLEPTPTLNLYKTPEYDILQVLASTSTTLTNTVTFYNTATILGTGTWVRSTATVLIGTTPYVQSGFARNFEILNNTATYTARSYTGTVASIPPWNFNFPAIWTERDTYNPIADNTGYIHNQIITSETNQTSPMTGVGWASTPNTLTVDSGNGQTYPKTSPVNYWDANPNMAIMNQLEGGFPYPKHPNKWTLFKYYDGSNYNLNAVSGTNVSAITDPISFGGWSVTQVERGGGSATPWRWDTIGDARGYNVIGIQVTTSTNRPLYNAAPGDSERLFFQGSTGTRHIDLVEFIGTATWQTTPLDPEVFLTAPTTSTVSVWLYKFTPTIPRPSNRFHKSNYPLHLCNLLSGAYPFNGFPSSSGPRITTLNENWIRYGVMYWLSTNTNSAQANDTALFYNEWFAAFTSITGNTVGRAEYGPSNTQTVTLYLPPNTISTTTGLHATWPGTQNLPRQFGKYYPFDIYKDPRPQATTITNAAYNIDNQGSPFAQIPTQVTGVVGSRNDNGVWSPIYGTVPNPFVAHETNFIKIISTVTLADPAFSRTIISGRVELYNIAPDMPQFAARGPARVLATATVVNSTATFNVSANQIFALANLNPKDPSSDYAREFFTRFISDSTATANSTSISMDLRGDIPSVSSYFYQAGLSYQPFVNGAISSTATFSTGSLLTVATPGVSPSIDTNTRISMAGNILIDFPFLATSTGTGKIFVELYYRKKTYTGGAFGTTPLTTSSWQPLILSNNGVATGVYANNVYGIEQSNTSTGKTLPLTIVPIAYQEFGFQAPYSSGGEASFTYTIDFGFKSFNENAAIPKFAQIGLVGQMVVRNVTPTS